MKDFIVFAVFWGVCVALITGTGYVVGEDPPQPSWTTRGIVTECYDGDTITISVTHKIRVRLLDTWVPEVKADNRLPESKRAAEKAAGIKSRDNLASLALGKEVVLQVPTDEDLLKSTTMGRVLGTVWLDGSDKSLNEMQVEGGFATKVKREELR